MSTAVSAAAIPPGWYTDPADPARDRWWNGTNWTHDVQTALAPLAPLAPLVVNANPVSSGAGGSSADAAYVPFQSTPSTFSPVHRGIAYTRSVWWITFYPLWALVPQAVLIALLVSAGIGDKTAIVFGSAALNIAAWLLLIVLAFSDRRALLAGGNGSAASAWWILLSPPMAYLIARTYVVRQWDAAGWGPLIWWIVATVLSPAIAVVSIFAVFGIVG